MTDKQIIIDDVDVSGCELYRDDNGVFAPDGTAERTELCYLTNDYCGNNPNCYYKQLKRKEQECEELKDLNTRLDNQREVYWKEYQKLKQAIEKVREIANKPYLLPCSGDCKQQNCTDKTTENGKHCMELKLIQILQICDEVNDGK